MSEKLMPCACGGTAVRENYDSAAAVRLKCSSCSYATSWWNHQIGAMREWNEWQRAQPPPPPQPEPEPPAMSRLRIWLDEFAYRMGF